MLSLRTVILFIFLSSHFFFLYSKADQSTSFIPLTYYDYTNEEIESLKQASTSERITKESLQKWDLILNELLQKNEFRKKGPYRLYVYLYTAQRDAAFLSYQAHGEFMGSIDQVSLMMLRVFFPDFQLPFPIKEDPYSLQLAKIVVPRYEERFNRVYKTIQKEESSFSIAPWTGSYQEFQEPVGSTPWLVSPLISQILAPPPPEDTAFWEKQLAEIKKNENKGLNIKLLLQGFWIRYQPIDFRNWIDIGNQYIFSHDLPLSKILLFRSIYAIGLYDVVLASIDAKVLFGIKRPSAINQEIHTSITPAYYYSFPSLHAGLAYTAASILTYFFPENQKYWERLAQETAFSRVSQQLNYPVDIQGAKDLSKKTVEELLHETPPPQLLPKN